MINIAYSQITKFIFNPMTLRVIILIVIFLCGVGFHSNYVEHKRLRLAEASLQRGQEAMLEYIGKMESEKNASDQIIQDLKGSVDGPAAPVINDYFDKLQKR